MDSTEFKLPDYFAEAFPGYSACNALACAAIQLEYDVLNGKVHHFPLSNARQSDKTVADIRMDSIAAGDLILRDLAYTHLRKFGIRPLYPTSLSLFKIRLSLRPYVKQR